MSAHDRRTAVWLIVLALISAASIAGFFIAADVRCGDVQPITVGGSLLLGGCR